MDYNIIPIKREHKTRLSIKVFSADRKSHKVAFEYASDGKKIMTPFFGNHSGEDVELYCDKGSILKVISGHGRFTHFRTDHTFKEKVDRASENILIKMPQESVRSCMFVIDTHLGKAYQYLCDVCLAFGLMEGAEVFFEEDEMMQSRKEAV